MRVPLFSIIVPTYGRPEMLAEALESVRSQTVEDFECIVVDDAGPEPARAPGDDRFRIVRRSTNGGEPAARNTGLWEARGRFVTFLDDDDVYTPERLELALEGLSRAPLAICWRRSLGGTGGRHRVLDGDVRDVIVDDLTPQLGQVAVERSAAMAFDERFAALTDVEWWLRAATRLQVSTVPRVGLLYRMHSGPRNRNGVGERVRCSVLLLDVHGDYFSSHPRAVAFRWKRIGLMASSLGDHALARRAYVRSLGTRMKVKTAWHLIRSLRPSTGKALERAVERSVGRR